MPTQNPTAKIQYLVFLLEGHPYAVSLSEVEHILRAVEITPVPGAPPLLRGLINLQGELLPVLNMRHCLNLPARDVELTDRLLILHSGGQKIALLVDEVQDIITPSVQEIIAVTRAPTETNIIRGAIKHNDQILFLCHFEDLPPLHSLSGAQTTAQKG